MATYIISFIVTAVVVLKAKSVADARKKFHKNKSYMQRAEMNDIGILRVERKKKGGKK